MMQRSRSSSRCSIGLLVVLAVTALLCTGVWWLLRSQSPTAPAPQSTSDTKPAPPAPAGPPWLYGRPDARFTLTGYADLECPYCSAYFSVLKRWMDAHPAVNWQWQHLPLAQHEPSASANARLAECAGQTGGHAAFWSAVQWVYDNTRGNGRGLPEGLRYPALTPAMEQCLASDRPDAVIRAQTSAAARDAIQATPTLRLQDNISGKTLLLVGPVEGDALLSAIDLLAAGGGEAPAQQAPADATSGTSR